MLDVAEADFELEAGVHVRPSHAGNRVPKDWITKFKAETFAKCRRSAISSLLVFAFHSTVIKTPRATILVDTCSGNDKERPHKPRYHRKNWPYLANLGAAGSKPSRHDNR
jgi:hypothetical protein